jgi:Family of unknown function (DUF5335)
MNMNGQKPEHEWNKYLRFFSEQNEGRPTRLGVFEPNSGAAADYWLECGLPLVGVDLDTTGGALTLQIIAGSLTHEVKNAVKVTYQITAAGDEDGLDVLDADGRLTVLRFENRLES